MLRDCMLQVNVLIARGETELQLLSKMDADSSQAETQQVLSATARARAQPEDNCTTNRCQTQTFAFFWDLWLLQHSSLHEG